MSTRRSSTARVLRSAPSSSSQTRSRKEDSSRWSQRLSTSPRVTERGSLSRRRSEVIPERWPRRQFWLPTKRRNYIPPGRRPRPLSRRPGTPETTAAAETGPGEGCRPSPGGTRYGRRLQEAVPGTRDAVVSIDDDDDEGGGPGVQEPRRPLPNAPSAADAVDPLPQNGAEVGCGPLRGARAVRTRSDRSRLPHSRAMPGAGLEPARPEGHPILPGAGLEPARPEGHPILSRARLTSSATPARSA